MLLTGVPSGWAAPRASDEILAALQTRLESGASFDDLLEQLDRFDPRELARLQAEFDKAWVRLREVYVQAFQAEARQQHSGPGRQEARKRVRELREDFAAVYALPEGPMKNALQQRSWPALQELRELLLPTAERILEKATPALKAQREQVLRLATFRDGILKAAVAIEAPETVAKIREQEVATAGEHSDLDRDGIRIMEKNREVARDSELPEAERLGIEDANLMRLLVGLPALQLDPRLCLAARGHSQDMQTMGFFSHTSPVPGKETPSARASQAGTSGGGENIFAGSNDPKAANKGWFFSPGHHKNMFNAGYGRIGLGNYGSHWTQMFGR